MTCLNLSNGFFSSITWSTAPSTNMGSVTVTRSATQITVQRAGLTGSVNSFGDFLYAVFGDMQFVALLGRNSAAGSITWTVSMVDITGASIGSTLLFGVTLPSSHSPPQLASSPGNGRLAFFWSGTGTVNEARNMMIVRSDDGSLVLAGPGTISNITGSPQAQITATQLIIHHPNTGPLDQTPATRPAGSLVVTPDPRDFGDAVLGASDPSLATVTRSFTFGNSGADCVTVTAIGNDPPFSVSPASLALLPIELDPGESQTVDVVFAPVTTGNNITGSLPVIRTPANGDSTLECTGDARPALAEISLSRSVIAFGTVPHPGTRMETFAITNSGEKDVFVNIPAAPPASAFTWNQVGTLNLAVGAAPITVTVTFTTPGDFAAAPQMLTVTPSEGTARTVTMTGAGCVPNAVPVIPPSAPIGFGELEQGFRTVRLIEVANNGDGDLVFTARITAGPDPAHAALFGLVLPDADITDAPATRTYTVLPTTRCGTGPTGSGRVPVAVSFHADSAPDTAPYTANLEVDDPVAGTTTSYPLSAIIVPAIPVDAVLVFDKSGSMNDPAGARTKIEAARSAGLLFAQMLRDTAEDRAAIIAFNETPTALFPIELVAGHRAALEGAFGTLAAGGATNIAGGLILGEDEFTDPVHPSSPPDLKRTMIVLTDGKENRCFQRGGAGAWFSITGRDATDPPEGMARPDGTPQDSEVLPIPVGIKVYGIAFGGPGDIDDASLNALSTATGGFFGQVEDMSGSDYFLLEKYFTQVFMETASLATIVDPFYTITVGEKHVIDFDIFPGDVNTMVVIYDEPDRRLPFYLLSPKGEQISSVLLPPGFGLRFRSTPTARFVEVTFPRGAPDRYAGRWSAIVLHEGRVCAGDINRPEGGGDDRHDRPDDADSQLNPGFLPRKCRDTKEPIGYGIAIGAGSNLRMQAFVEPGTKFVGDPLRLNAVLAEAGLPVKSSTVRVTVQNPLGTSYVVVLRDDGLNDDGAPDDGDYGGRFTQTTVAGVYRLAFRAEGFQGGRPYVREASRTKAIYDRRQPPTGDPDGDDCCRKLLQALRQAPREDVPRSRESAKGSARRK